MKKILFLSLILLPVFNFAQLQTITNPETSVGILIKITPPLSNFSPDPSWINEIIRNEDGRLGEDLTNVEHRIFHPNAISKPKIKDPVIQDYFGIKRKSRATNILQNFNGHPNTGVSPADPSLCVGPNHVIQMINGSSGARLIIYNKVGGIISAAQYMDAITGVPGLGDPVALYDQFADRFILTEFSSTGNKLIMMVSQTSNPTGSWYVYQFTAPSFPDYPKYSIWPNAFVCTTNESTNKIYAMDRIAMLAGTPTSTFISFSIPGSPSVGFQAAAPVNISGTSIPPVGTLPLIMRMTDDAWGLGLNDELEMWELNLNFPTPASSTLNQLPSLTTAPFASDLCGYTTLNCIRQPGNTRLDPIREIIMNRIWYRNFGTHQSIVLNHSVDASAGLDQAGIRWYELRRNGLGPWSIYQQSTYAPDTNSRWMGTIAINSAGSIGLAYSVSSKNVFPSYRFTGRKATDPLNVMTENEQTIIAGSTNQSNNRWGDYSDMQIDPSNDLNFWTTGMYMPNPAPWTTRIAEFSITAFPLPLNLLSFEGEKINSNIVKLSWTTEEENLVQSFEIERKLSSETKFTKIAEVKALNKITKTDYEFLDENFIENLPYQYRLKMIDIDQKYRYSNIVDIKGSEENLISFYPNPVDEILYLKLGENYLNQQIKIEIYNLQAQLILSFEKSTSTKEYVLPFNISTLSAGMYNIITKKVSGEIISKNNLLKK